MITFGDLANILLLITKFIKSYHNAGFTTQLALYYGADEVCHLTKCKRGFLVSPHFEVLSLLSHRGIFIVLQIITIRQFFTVYLKPEHNISIII